MAAGRDDCGEILRIPAQFEMISCHYFMYNSGYCQDIQLHISHKVVFCIPLQVSGNCDDFVVKLLLASFIEFGPSDIQFKDFCKFKLLLAPQSDTYRYPFRGSPHYTYTIMCD